jgi:hypothetical protein
MVRLFTSYYRDRSVSRQAELIECLQRNVSLDVIDSICVLLEKTESPFPDHPKLKTRQISHRPRYADFFDWANELRDSNHHTCMITNSDIYFDSSVSALIEGLKPEQCAALSRWDVQRSAPARLFDRSDSQDAWIFRGKIRPMNADFCVGIPRCDNRILYELRAVGYEVINPAFSVKAYHLHAGERGEYPGKIQGLHVDPPYNYLWPHNLKSLPATLLHNLRHPDSKLGWRIDWRKLQRTLPWRAVDKLKRLAARSKSENL